MRKNIKKVLCSVVCFALLPMVVLSGCSSCKKKKSDKDGDTDNTTVEKVRYTEGIHDLTAPETDKWLVQNGQSEYKILLPYDASDVLFAKEELTTRFQEATGVTLVSETESTQGKVHSADEKYISLGNTKMLQSAGITVDEKVLGADGVRIVTKDSTIYITGGYDTGTLNGVYDFLQIYFNYDWFYHDCYSLDTNVKNVKLRNFDVMDVPDVEIRVGANGYTNGSVYTNYSVERFRYNRKGYGSVFLPDMSAHNGFRLINNETPGWEKYGSSWYADTGRQLCYTAHGNQEAYDAMVLRIAEKFQNAIIQTKNSTLTDRYDATITTEDNTDMCRCAACQADIDKYGSNTGSIIKLCNAVMAQVKDVWMKSDEGKPYADDRIRCSFFAYQSTIDPPNVILNEEGIYEVENPEIAMRDDVGVWLCFTKKYNAALNFYAKENNEFREHYAKWADISSFIHTWGYEANFFNFFDMYNSFDFYGSDLLQFCVNKGVSMWWSQNIGTGKDVTAFNGLKEYIKSKLTWDCTLDTNELTDKYFAAMFAEASDVMKEFFNYSRISATQVRYEFGPNTPGTGGSLETKKVEYQPLPVLRKKMAYCDEAIEIIDRLYKEQNPAKYEQLRYHIDLEYFSPAYHVMVVHGKSSLGDVEYSALANRLWAQHQKFDVMSASEGAKGKDIKSDVQSWATGK